MATHFLHDMGEDVSYSFPRTFFPFFVRRGFTQFKEPWIIKLCELSILL